MKRIFIIALAMMLILSTALFTGCSNDAKDTNDNTNSEAVQGNVTDSGTGSDIGEETALSEKAREALAIIKKVNMPDNFSAEEYVLMEGFGSSDTEYTLECEVEGYNTSDVKYKGEVTQNTEDGKVTQEMQEAGTGLVGPATVMSMTIGSGIEEILEVADITIKGDSLTVQYHFEGDELRERLEKDGADEETIETMKSISFAMSLKIDWVGYLTELDIEMIIDSGEAGKTQMSAEGKYSDFK